MTHDELLALLNAKSDSDEVHALRAVVALHKPEPLDERGDVCLTCCPDLLTLYPCPTIQAIEKELGSEEYIVPKYIKLLCFIFGHKWINGCGDGSGYNWCDRCFLETWDDK